MSKTDPTARPWRRHTTEEDAIVGPDRKPIAMVSSLGKRPEAEDAANLVLINRAVNAHDELVAGVKALSAAISESRFKLDVRKDFHLLNVQACAGKLVHGIETGTPTPPQFATEGEK